MSMKRPAFAILTGCGPVIDILDAVVVDAV
jgi:hypothetical protein